MDYLVPRKLRFFVRFFEVLGISSTAKYRYLFGLVFNLIVIVVLLFFIHRDSLLYSPNDFAFVDEFNDAFQLIITFATVLSLFLETIHRKSTFKKFFELVTELDLTFRDLHVDPEIFYSRLNQVYGRQFLVLLCGTIGLEIFIIISIDSDHDWSLYWLVNIMPLMINRFRHLQYSFMLRIIVVQLEMMESILEKIVQISDKKFPKNETLNCGIQRRLRRLSAAYNFILEEVKAFNKMFSYSLVINLFQNLIELLSGSYWLYFYALKNELVVSGQYIAKLVIEM